MWKTITSLTLILLITCGSILFMQWNDFTTHVDASGNVSVKVKQEINVETTEDSLVIEQKIIGLSKGTNYSFTIPTIAKDVVCSIDGVVCEQISNNSFKSVGDNITFNYKLIFEGDVEWLLEEWVVRLSDTYITESRVQVVDAYKREGTFIVGSLLQGAVSKENIEFYVFKGYSDVGALYWHPAFLNHVRLTDYNDLYYSGLNTMDTFDFSILKEYKDSTYVSLVATNNENSYQKGILFVGDSTTNDNLNRQTLFNYYYLKYGAENNWLADFVISNKLDIPFLTSAAEAITNDLLNNIGEEALSNLVNNLDKNELEWDHQVIDEYITSSEKYRMYLFTDNKDADTYLPIELFGKKLVYVNDEPKYDIRSKIVNGTTYYPLLETLESVGYKVEYNHSDKSIDVIHDEEEEVFKFYLNNNLFVYNDRRYGLKESALTFLDGSSYTTDVWLKSLFSININELEDRLVLVKR